jgi:hypothetical protein
MSLIQALPQGSLDIVGDIHGELQALRDLLMHLGYSTLGHHPDGRTLVFVGDFCDRGPDSPGVLALVQSLVESKRAVAILGNHEINLLRGDVKDGSGWFFDARVAQDNEKYAPYQRPDAAARTQIIDFLSRLPIGLERADLRVIHAAWRPAQIAAARRLPMGTVCEYYDAWERAAFEEAAKSDLKQGIATELQRWTHSLEDQSHMPPFLDAHAEMETVKQMHNPLKVLTSGVECKGEVPYYASGKWRFVDRVQWWNEYVDNIPVVIGHYWRRFNQNELARPAKGIQNMFETTPPQAWHGKLSNVFCIDFSVGGRWSARKNGSGLEQQFKLAALRWPEGTLQFDDGHTALTHKEVID